MEVPRPQGPEESSYWDINALLQEGTPADAKHESECTSFRTQLFQKLQQHGVLHEGTGWAIFEVPSEDVTQDDTIYDGIKDILISVHPFEGSKKVDNFTLPEIRIITNERVSGEEAGTFLTVDFTLTPHNATGYFVDSASLLSACDESRGLAAIFTAVEGGKLGRAKTFPPATPREEGLRGKNATSAEDNVYPFGISGQLEDDRFVLGEALRILQSIQDVEPTAGSYGGN